MTQSLFKQFITGLEKLDLCKQEKQLSMLIEALKTDLRNGKIPTQNELASKMLDMITLFPSIMDDKNNHELKKACLSVHPSKIELQPRIYEKLFYSEAPAQDKQPHPSTLTKK